VNQVMINSVDLEMLVQEIKDLKVKIAELNKLLADERGRNKVPESHWLEGVMGRDMTKDEIAEFDKAQAWMSRLIHERNRACR
jgi:hypothetical protein